MLLLLYCYKRFFISCVCSHFPIKIDFNFRFLSIFSLVTLLHTISSYFCNRCICNFKIITIIINNQWKPRLNYSLKRELQIYFTYCSLLHFKRKLFWIKLFQRNTLNLWPPSFVLTIQAISIFTILNRNGTLEWKISMFVFSPHVFFDNWRGGIMNKKNLFYYDFRMFKGL